MCCLEEIKRIFRLCIVWTIRKQIQKLLRRIVDFSCNSRISQIRIIFNTLLLVHELPQAKNSSSVLDDVHVFQTTFTTYSNRFSSHNFPISGSEQIPYQSETAGKAGIVRHLFPSLSSFFISGSDVCPQLSS